MNQNNSHLIAGFFRYHREKLNYSLRGLVGDGKVVDLSSLSAFERGKRFLKEEQLTYLFNKINCDYLKVVGLNNFKEEYEKIIDYICLGETKKAESLYFECVEHDVFNTLGCINFLLVKFILSLMNSRYIEEDSTCEMFEDIYLPREKSMLFIAKASKLKNSGDFNSAIEILKDAEKITYDAKILAWKTHLSGVIYGLSGSYTEATIALLDAKQKYGELLGIVRMIQINLNLGTTYFLTNSYDKAEESYLHALQSAATLKESSYLLTKCFNSLCWLYFKTNQYNKVNELLSDKPDIVYDSTNTYFVLAWASYKIGKYEDAVKYALEGKKKFSHNEYACTVYKYIENAALGKKTGQDALLKKAIEMKDKENNKEFNELLIREIIDIYERRKNYEKAFKYAKKLLNR